MVFWAIGGVPVIKGNVKTLQIRLAPFCNVGHKLLRCDASLLRRNHDGGSVGIISADEIHLVALHALETHPNIGLDVLHDVANMKIAIGIR